MAWTELTVDEWNHELDRGLEFRRKYGAEDSWAENEQLFYQQREFNDNSGPNIIFSNGDTFLSSVTVPYPYISLTPQRFDAVEGCKVVERIDNQLLESMNVPGAVEDACLNAYLWGVGFLKIGFDSEFGYDPKLEAMKDTGLTLTQVDDKGNRIEFGTASPGMPWVESVLPHDIVVPWGTKDVETAEWVAHRVIRHIKDVKADPKYKNKSDLEPNISMEDVVKSYSTVLKPYRMGQTVKMGVSPDGESDCVYVELWEIHDRRTGKLYVIATGHDQFLRKEVDYIQLACGMPFIQLGFIPSTRSVWRTSHATYLRQVQAETTDISIMASKQRRIQILKFLVSEDAMEDNELETLLSHRVGAAAKVKSGFDIDKAIRPFQPGQNPQIYAEIEQVRRNAREITGMSANQTGEYDKSTRRTATEAGIVDQSSQMRGNKSLLKVGRAYKTLSRKVNGLIFKFWRTPRIIDVVGEDGLVKWVSYVGHQLAGEYSYSVSFTQQSPMSPQQRKQEALQMYQLLAADPMADPIQVRRYVSGAFNDQNFSSIWKPGVLEGDPNALLQLQMSSMQGGGGGTASNGRMLPAGGMSGMSGGNLPGA